MEEKIFLKGTEAIAEAAVRAGCRFMRATPSLRRTRYPNIFHADCQRLAEPSSRARASLPPSTWYTAQAPAAPAP